MNMKKFDRESQKKHSISRIFKSFKYAKEGIITSYKEEQNLIIHTIAAIIAVLLGIFFHISSIEFCLVILSIGFVIVCEIINTALENLCDFCTDEYTPLVKKVKDCGAAAVLMASITSLIIGIIIFLPKIITIVTNIVGG